MNTSIQKLMDSRDETQFSFLKKKGIASAFAQANRSLIEKNKLLQAEALASKAESDRLRKLNAELRAKISVLESASEDDKMRCIVESRLKRKFVRLQLIAKRAVTYLENVIKDFDSVLTSESLLPELDLVPKNVQLGQSVISRPSLETVEESPVILHSITMRNFLPFKSDELEFFPSSSKKCNENDVVNDSLEDKTLNSSQDDMEKIDKSCKASAISSPSTVDQGTTTALLNNEAAGLSSEPTADLHQEMVDFSDKEKENSFFRYFEPTQRRRGRKFTLSQDSNADTRSICKTPSPTGANESLIDNANSNKSKLDCTGCNVQSSGKRSRKCTKLNETKSRSRKNKNSVKNEIVESNTPCSMATGKASSTAIETLTEELVNENQYSHRPSRSCCKAVKSYKLLPLNAKLRRLE